MDCEQTQALLVAEMDRELAPEDRACLATHLQTCAGCRETANALAMQDADLRRAFAPRRQAVAGIIRQVLTRLEHTRTTRRQRWPWLSWSVAAAAGFLVAVLVFRPWSREAATTKAVENEAARAQQTEKGGNQLVAVQSTPPETVALCLANDKVFTCPSDSDSWEAVETGERIALGTRIRTGPTVRCEFRTADGSEVRLNSGTEMRFSAGRQLELTKGQIFARVAKASTPFQVHIPEAVVTALGTEFDILCRPADSVVTVLEGSTRLSCKGPDVVVGSREQARIVNGQIAEHGQVHDLLQSTGWVMELLKLKGRENKEFSERVEDLLAQIGDLKTGFLGETDIRALGDHCVRPLTRFVQSPRSQADIRKRRMASRIVADLAQPWSIPDLIQLLNDKDDEVRMQAARGLQRLTKETQNLQPDEWRRLSGGSLENAIQKWRAWWEENKQRFGNMPW